MEKTFDETPVRCLGFNKPNLLSHFFFDPVSELLITPKHTYIMSPENEHKVATDPYAHE